MPELTPRLALPLVAAGQAQKHVPVNEALTILDAIVQLSVLDRTQTEPPSSPLDGNRYIVAAGATDAWSGHDGDIATYNAGWIFTAPTEGWRAWDASAQELVVFTGDAWTVVTSGTGGVEGGDLQNIALLGIGAEADETNPFSAKLNNALWTARESGEDGTGDLRYVLNKEASANVLSLLMQSAYGGRAEIGLIGDEDLLFKVSDDGSIWREAIRIDKATGRPSFPQGGVREQLIASRIYYVRTDGSDSNNGLSNTSGGAFLTLAKAMSVVAGLDIGIYTVTVKMGDSGNFAGFTLAAPWVGSGTVVLEGDTSTPANTVVTSMILVGNGAQLTVKHFKTSVSLQSNLRAQNNGIINLGPGLEFGNTQSSHLHALNDGIIMSPFGQATYTISGGGSRHIQCDQATINMRSGTVTLTGTPAFSIAYAALSVGGKVFHDLITYSSSATGKRYDITGNSVMSTGGATLPGNLAGMTGTGGQYI